MAFHVLPLQQNCLVGSKRFLFCFFLLIFLWVAASSFSSALSFTPGNRVDSRDILHSPSIEPSLTRLDQKRVFSFPRYIRRQTVGPMTFCRHCHVSSTNRIDERSPHSFRRHLIFSRRFVMNAHCALLWTGEVRFYENSFESPLREHGRCFQLTVKNLIHPAHTFTKGIAYMFQK